MKKSFISLAIVLAASGSLCCSESWQRNGWVDSTETDPMTDEVTESISFTGHDGLYIQLSCLKAGGQFHPTLAVRFAPHGPLRRGDVDSMQVRIDEGAVHSHDELLWVGRPASALIHEMSSGEVILVRIIRDEHNRFKDHTISLFGFKERLDAVLSFCDRFPRPASLATEK
jgi:hypothetical protein